MFTCDVMKFVIDSLTLAVCFFLHGILAYVFSSLQVVKLFLSIHYERFISNIQLVVNLYLLVMYFVCKNISSFQLKGISVSWHKKGPD